MKTTLGKIIIISFFSLLAQFEPILIYGQNNKITLISTHFDEAVNDVSEDLSGNIYLVGYRSNPHQVNLDTAIGIIWKLNKNIVQIDSLYFEYQSKACRLININRNNTHNFVINGFTYDTTMQFYKNTIKTFKVDTNLNVSDSFSIQFADSISGWGLRQDITFNNEILIWGNIKNGYNKAPQYSFLGLYSMDFDSIRFKILDSDIWYNSFTKKLNNNNYFIAGGSKLTSSAPFEYMTLDSSFNFINIADIPEHNNPFDLKWDTDTSFYLIAHWATTTNHLIGMLYQKSINNIDDYIFNTWGTADTFDLPATHNAIDYNNKDSIFIGGTNNFAYGQSVYAHVPSFFSIIQTDSLLNVRWERFYGGDAYYIMNSVLATNDGGCLLVGSKYDYKNTDELQRDIYILKLNNEGLITSTNENQSSLMHEAIVFPNPGTNRFNVRIAAQYAKSTIEVYNINGELIIKKEIEGKWAEIETYFLKSGTYIYNIYNKQGLFESGKWIKN